MRVYIVIVENQQGYHLSQDGFATYEAAKRFIESRADHPGMDTPFKFVSNRNTYLIHDVSVK